MTCTDTASGLKVASHLSAVTGKVVIIIIIFIFVLVLPLRLRENWVSVIVRQTGGNVLPDLTIFWFLFLSCVSVTHHLALCSVLL